MKQGSMNALSYGIRTFWKKKGPGTGRSRVATIDDSNECMNSPRPARAVTMSTSTAVVFT